jgi:hypothetical protein
MASRQGADPDAAKDGRHFGARLQGLSLYEGREHGHTLARNGAERSHQVDQGPVRSLRYQAAPE